MADNMSLFGPSPQEAQQGLQQLQQAQAMQFAGNMGPQGNPFYVPGIAATGHMAGAQLGQGLGQLFGVQPPAIERAYKMQAVQQAVEEKGIDIGTDPVGYAKVAASEMLKAGMHDEALKAIQWAQQQQTEAADVKYKGAMGDQAQAVATEKMELLDEKKADMEARTVLTQAKTEITRTKNELAKLEEARKAVREPKQLELLDARINQLRADAAALGERAVQAAMKGSPKSMNQLYTNLLQEDYAAGRITREELLSKLEVGLVDPIRQLTALVAGGGLPSQPPVRGPDGAPVPPKPSQQTPAPQATIEPVAQPYPATPGGGPYKPQPNYNFKKAAEAAWGKYEPAKYNYRVNPDTGRVQRAPK